MDKNTVDDAQNPAAPLANAGQSAHAQTTITNEVTLWRRDWIDRAVSSVKSRLAPVSPETPRPAKSRSKPALYVAWSRSEDSAD